MNSEVERLPSDDLLERCGEAWGLRHCVFVRKMENIVYVCDSDVGKVYLRLTTPLRRARAEIEAEINWIEHLAKCGLNVPELVPDKRGNKIVSFKDGPQHFEAVVFHAIVGEHPSKEKISDPEFLKTLGALIATMHLATLRYEGMHQGLKREEWFEERGIRHALTALPHSPNSHLRGLFEEAVAWMRGLEQSEETYGLIHADLGALNLLVAEDSSINVIDFDDSCYHWFVLDLGVVIASTIIAWHHNTSADKETAWREALAQGYRTVRPLSQKEVDLIPKFVDFVFLRLYFWIEYHQGLHTFHDDAIDRVAELKDKIQSRF